jgi:hypothetical protein
MWDVTGLASDVGTILAAGAAVLVLLAGFGLTKRGIGKIGG